LRVLDTAAVTPVPEGEGACCPFFSADNRWVGFSANRKLKKALVSNMSVAAICDMPAGASGASWGPRGTIVFASGGNLYDVAESGGQPQLLAAPDREARETAYFVPEILPPGDVVLAHLNRLPNLSEVVSMPLNGGPRKRVLTSAARELSWSSTGRCRALRSPEARGWFDSAFAGA